MVSRPAWCTADRPRPTSLPSSEPPATTTDTRGSCGFGLVGQPDIDEAAGIGVFVVLTERFLALGLLALGALEDA